MKSKAVWISCILAALFCGCAANARVIMMLEQVGPNVVGTGSGTIDPAGLSFLHNGGSAPGIGPGDGELVVGQFMAIAFYTGFSGPASFGSIVGSTHVSTSSGDQLGINASGSAVPLIFVPEDYVSGSELSGTATWDNTTLVGLHVTPGIYTWRWGSGEHTDSLRLLLGSRSRARVRSPALPRGRRISLVEMAMDVGWRWRWRMEASDDIPDLNYQ